MGSLNYGFFTKFQMTKVIVHLVEDPKSLWN